MNFTKKMYLSTLITFFLSFILFNSTTICAQNDPCIAGFSYSTVSGTMNLIQFNDESVGGDPNTLLQIIDWYWDFGNGAMSNEQNPVMQFSTGTFTVCLTIITTSGCTSTSCQDVVVGNPPPPCSVEANFEATVGNATVFFTDLSTGDVSAWYWDFGDGTTSTEQNPSHTYGELTTYWVCLTVTNGDPDNSCTDSYCDFVYFGGNNGNCTASFTYDLLADGSVEFNGTAGDPNVQVTSWFWDFGDGNTSTEQNPNYSFEMNSSGTYTVCLTITTANGCTDESCQTVFIGNNNGNCNAEYSFEVMYPPSGSPYVEFSDETSGGVLAWDWTFGDGTGSSEQNPVHYFADGTYTVCLTITVSTFAGTTCTDTECKNITVGNGSTNCFATFQYSANESTVSFFNASVGGNANNQGLSYLWDFGDGNTSTELNPVYTYEEAGDYEVCLTISNADGSCTDTYCVTLTVNEPSLFFNICGSVYVGVNVPSGDNSYTVWLIEHDEDEGTLYAVDSIVLESNPGGIATYCFNYLNTGSSYLVKAALNEASEDYWDFLPTYYDNVLFWDEATYVSVTNMSVNIYLIPGNNPGGPGFIGGYISEGAGKTTGEGGIVNVPVYLLNMDESPLTYRYSDENGNYTFDDIPYGTYWVHIEIPGKTAERYEVTIEPDSPIAEDINFKVFDTEILINETTGLHDNDKLNLQGISLYPSPAKDIAYLQINMATNAQINVSISDVNGKNLMTWEQNLNQGQHQLPVVLKDWPEGLYLVKVQASGSEAYEVLKLFKQ